MNGGTSFKADNGFKLRFLNTIVEKLKAKVPESNLKLSHMHILNLDTLNMYIMSYITW